MPELTRCCNRSASAELIPAKFYFSNDAAAARSFVENKYSKNKKRKAPKQAVKEASTKAKKAKLNPDAHTSNRERLLAGAFAQEDAAAGDNAAEDAEDSGKEGGGMDDLKQRLLLRVEELRKQRAATAHRKITGAVATKVPRVKDEKEKREKKKTKRQEKDEAKAEAAAEAKANVGANGTSVDAAARPNGKVNTNTDDFQFAAKVGKTDPREKAQRRKTDEALLKKAKRFDQEMEVLDDVRIHTHSSAHLNLVSGETVF